MMNTVDAAYLLPEAGYNHYFLPVINHLVPSEETSVRFIYQSEKSNELTYFEKDVTYSDGTISRDDLIKRLSNARNLVQESNFQSLAPTQVYKGNFKELDIKAPVQKYFQHNFIDKETDYLQINYDLKLSDQDFPYKVELIILPYALDYVIDHCLNTFFAATQETSVILNSNFNKLCNRYSETKLNTLFDQSDQVISISSRNLNQLKQSSGSRNEIKEITNDNDTKLFYRMPSETLPITDNKMVKTKEKQLPLFVEGSEHAKEINS